MKGKRILLTGGGGFIGTALAYQLLSGNRVVIYDNGYRQPLEAHALSSHPDVQLIQGDVTDAAGVREAMRDCHIVVHLAAIAGVDTVLRMPVTTMKVALLGTYNVLEAALRGSQVERLIDFSTSEVFGAYAYNAREGDVTSLGAVGEARWTYAVSKLAMEHLAHNYHKQFGLPTVAIRPFNIYGPGQVGEGAVHRFVVRAIRGEDLEIHGDGSQIRAWCYIDDIVEGILLCMEKAEAIGQTFNIGNPRSACTIYDLARQVIHLANATSGMHFVHKDRADVELRVPNIDKARELLGYEPKIDLEEGLLRTIAWYRQRDSA